MIKKHPLRFTALIFFVIFCALSSFVYLTLGSGSISALIEQMLHREQVITRSGAKSIASFIDLSSKSLIILANDENLTPDKIKNFIDKWANTPLTGIILTDSQGQVVTAFSNTESLSSGGNIADRDYFQAAMESSPQKIIVGKPVISRISGANQNYKIPIATPVFYNNQFNGVLSFSISIPILTNDYLDPLKISDQTDIILLDKQGHIFNSIHFQIVGQNIFEYVDQNPFLGDKIVMPILKEKIGLNSEFKLDIVIPNPTTGKLTRTLIASAPIFINSNNQWILAITTPVSDALIFISPFIFKNILLIIFSFFISIAATLFLFNHYIKN